MRSIRRPYYLSFFALFILSGLLFSSCGSSKKAGSTKKKYLSDEDANTFKSTYYDATKKKILGDYDMALSMFRQCLAIDPSSAAANYEMADILEYEKHTDTALVFASRAVKLEPSNVWYQELYAQCLQEKGRYKEVEEIYKGLIKDHPLVSDYYYKLAVTQLQSGSLIQAAQTYELAEQKLGFNEQVQMNVVEIYERAKDYVNAERAIQELINHFPGVPQYYDMLGNLYEMQGKSDKAFEVYQKMEQTSPDDPMVHLSLADYYRERHDEKMAFEELQMAFKQPSLDIDTKMRILYTNFFQISTGTDSIAKQGIILTKLMVDADPKEPKAHYMYGEFLYHSGDPQAAREEYKIAVGQDSSKYIWWNKILVIDEQLNDYTSLATTSKLVISLFPNYTDPYLLNGIANYQLKHYQNAISVLRQGMGYIVDDSAAASNFLSLMGDSYNSLKQYSSSDSAYEQALKYDANNYGVLNNYGYYLSLRDTNLAKAEMMSKKSNTLAPNNPTYEDTYAWILYKMKKYTEAKDWEDKALQHGGAKDNALLDHYGDILFKLGSKDKAVEYWQQAKDGGLKSDLLDKKIRDKQLYEK